MKKQRRKRASVALVPAVQPRAAPAGSVPPCVKAAIGTLDSHDGALLVGLFAKLALGALGASRETIAGADKAIAHAAEAKAESTLDALEETARRAVSESTSLVKHEK